MHAACAADDFPWDFSLFFFFFLSRISHFSISHLASRIFPPNFFFTEIYLASCMSLLGFRTHLAFFYVASRIFLCRISHFPMSHLAFFYVASRIFLSRISHFSPQKFFSLKFISHLACPFWASVRNSDTVTFFPTSRTWASVWVHI